MSTEAINQKHALVRDIVLQYGIGNSEQAEQRFKIIIAQHPDIAAQVFRNILIAKGGKADFDRPEEMGRRLFNDKHEVFGCSDKQRAQALAMIPLETKELQVTVLKDDGLQQIMGIENPQLHRHNRPYIQAPNKVFIPVSTPIQQAGHEGFDHTRDYRDSILVPNRVYDRIILGKECGHYRVLDGIDYNHYGFEKESKTYYDPAKPAHKRAAELRAAQKGCAIL